MSRRFVPISSEDVDGVRDSLVSVYRDTFTLPPYNEGEEDIESFEEKLERHSVRDGFRLVAAYESREIVGFAYGFDGGENGWTRSIVEPLLSEEETEVWLSDYFEFVELAVSPEARCRGFGGRLHDELLDGLPHRSAALFAAPEAEAAMGLYRRRGWQTLVEGLRFPEVEHPVSAMGLGLGGGG